MSEEKKKNTIVLFPFMAQGHLIPFLSLANLLQKRSPYSITILNTPHNIKILRSRVSADSTERIRFVELAFNSEDHGLPPNSDNTDALPYPLIIRLFEASETLKPAFERFLSTNHLSVLCIVSDMFFGWTVGVARKFNVVHTSFNGGGAYGFALYFSVWLNLPHVHNKDLDEFSLPGFDPPVKINKNQMSSHLRNSNGKDSWAVFLQRHLCLSMDSDGFLFNTIESIDSFGLNYFKRMTGRPVWAIGPLRPVNRVESKTFFLDNFLQWLNNNEQCSTLYISFGSQNTISLSDMMILATGLQSSKCKFIWVVRPPIGFDSKGEFRPEWLPEGFEEQMKEKNQGIVVKNWAPQIEILSHKSIGAFLSHCGWNSVLESLSYGVPIIGWPMAAEQFYNSKMLEELGVCLEIARGVTESGIKEEQVVNTIHFVMGASEKAIAMKRKSSLIQDMILKSLGDEEDGGRKESFGGINNFIQTVESLNKRELSQLVEGK